MTTLLMPTLTKKVVAQQEPKKEPPTHAALAKQFLRDRGIPLPEQPAEEERNNLRLPDKLDTLATSEVTQEMLKWSRMLAYVKSELALAEIRHRQAEDAYDKSREVELLRLRGDNPRSTVKDLNAHISSKKSFQRMNDKVLELDARRKLLNAVHDGYDQNYKLLSRELTRRTNYVGDRGLET